MTFKEPMYHIAYVSESDTRYHPLGFPRSYSSAKAWVRSGTPNKHIFRCTRTTTRPCEFCIEVDLRNFEHLANIHSTYNTIIALQLEYERARD